MSVSTKLAIHTMSGLPTGFWPFVYLGQVWVPFVAEPPSSVRADTNSGASLQPREFMRYFGLGKGWSNRSMGSGLETIVSAEPESNPRARTFKQALSAPSCSALRPIRWRVGSA